MPRSAEPSGRPVAPPPPGWTSSPPGGPSPPSAHADNGGDGGFCADPWLTGLVLLGLAGSSRAADVVASSSRWLTGAVRPEGHWDLMPLDLTWSQFAARALLDAGPPWPDRLAPTTAMFTRSQGRHGSELLRYPPGGWGHVAASWPFSLETAEIAAVLVRTNGAGDPAVTAAVRWLWAQQDRAGSWSLTVRNSRPGGFGPCPYVTAQVVLALLDTGVAPTDARIRRAADWVTARREPDGSVEALWYRGRVPGTSALLEMLGRLGRGTGEPARAAAAHLYGTQNPDGSWGDGAAPGTVEETAWALRALSTAAARHPVPDAGRSTARGAATAYLLDTQRPDGSWPGGPVNDHVRACYRFADPVIATGLALRALAAAREDARATTPAVTHEEYR
ncbi:prenyltransferase/squalene oxidase repeat-containing protein [Pseudonocardia sp. HH130630-07]|uniref:prenyltransferase/squalene oxidase repeat-containing protein n=1 Tax=Pseudonocardia sp. HH130630-07 TaxID=1690815 RepID=UPI000815130A|nr:prenyltransferase/squalene oxidase repeat-containing protein [Pseudonocardia sp. HH130630-07]ANY07673.1 hypothetical protein AFB00_16765 [Pseudonocardia sp. HH130630-07]